MVLWQCFSIQQKSHFLASVIPRTCHCVDSVVIVVVVIVIVIVIIVIVVAAAFPDFS